MEHGRQDAGASDWYELAKAVRAVLPSLPIAHVTFLL
jgi:hypothetical protein